MKERSIGKNVIWNTSGNIIYCICQWVITILVVRLSGFENAGYLSLAMTVSSSFSAIGLFRMRDFQVSDVRGEFACGEYVASRVISAFAALVLCVVYASFGNSFYQVICIAAFMLVRTAEAFTDVMHGIDQKHDRYDLIGISYILRGIATVLSFSLVLYFSDSLFAALLVMALLNLLIAVVFDMVRTSKLESIRPLFGRRLLTLFGKCLPIVVFTFLTAFINLIPKQIIADVMGTERLGVYSSIASPTLIVQVFASVVFAPFLPGISRLIADKDSGRLKKSLRKLYAAFAALCVIVPIVASLIGKWGLKLLLGEAVLADYDIFIPVVWCTVCLAIVWILSSVTVAFRKTIPMLAGMAASFIVCVAFCRFLIYKTGINGASYIQVISYIISIAVMIVICEVSARRKE